MGFEPTIVSLEDAKRKGLNDLVESVQLDVMDLLNGKKLTYVNASHQIIRGGAGYKLVINLVYPIVIQRNIIVITVIRTITVITVKVYRASLLLARLGDHGDSLGSNVGSRWSLGAIVGGVKEEDVRIRDPDIIADVFAGW